MWRVRYLELCRYCLVVAYELTHITVDNGCPASTWTIMPRPSNVCQCCPLPNSCESDKLHRAQRVKTVVCVCVYVVDCRLQHNADDTQWRRPCGTDYWTEDVGSVWQSAGHCRHTAENHSQQQPDEHFCLCRRHQTTAWQQVGIVIIIIIIIIFVY